MVVAAVRASWSKRPTTGLPREVQSLRLKKSTVFANIRTCLYNLTIPTLYMVVPNLLHSTSITSADPAYIQRENYCLTQLINVSITSFKAFYDNWSGCLRPRWWVAYLDANSGGRVGLSPCQPLRHQHSASQLSLQTVNVPSASKTPHQLQVSIHITCFLIELYSLIRIRTSKRIVVRSFHQP